MEWRASLADVVFKTLGEIPTLAEAKHNDNMLGSMFTTAAQEGGGVLVDPPAGRPAVPIHNLKLLADPSGLKRASFRGQHPTTRLVRVDTLQEQSGAAIEIATNGVGMHNTWVTDFELYYQWSDPGWGQFHQGVQLWEGIPGCVFKLGHFNNLHIERINVPYGGGGKIINTGIVMDQHSSPISLTMRDVMMYVARLGWSITTATRAGGAKARDCQFLGPPGVLTSKTLGMAMAPTDVWDTFDMTGVGFGDMERGTWIMGPAANLKFSKCYWDAIRTDALYLSGPAASNPNKYTIAGTELTDCWVRSNGTNINIEPATGIIDTVTVSLGSLGDASGSAIAGSGNLRRIKVQGATINNAGPVPTIDIGGGVDGVEINGNTINTPPSAPASIRIHPSAPSPTCQANNVTRPILPSYLMGLNTLKS